MVGTSIEFDTVLDVCQHEHRRIVLAALEDSQQPVTTNDLAKAIDEHNHHVPLTDAAGEAVAQVRAVLHHVHLPKLDEAGLVEYDSRRQLVEPTAELEQGVPHVSAILDADVELAMPLDV